MSKHTYLFLCLISFVFLFNSTKVFANTCGKILSNDNTTFIVFYADMLNRGGLSLGDLQDAKEAIESGEGLPNPFIAKMHGDDSTVQLLRSSKFVSLRSLNSSTSDLLNWLKRQVLILEEEAEKDKEVSNETRVISEKAFFHPVKAGSYKYKPHGHDDPYSVKLLQDFEMQTKLVTQGQWAEIMGTHPSLNQGSYEGESRNHPVENITIWSAMEFANRFSIQDGYEPVYNLDSIQFEGSPETGDYNPTDEVVDLVINAPDNDIYQAEGYRLPTLAEYFMVITNRGKIGSEKSFRAYFKRGVLNPAEYFNYVDGGTTVESGSLKPMQSNGYDFYDLIGNVSNLTSDHFTGINVVEGANPLLRLKALRDSGGFSLIGSPYGHQNVMQQSFLIARAERSYKSGAMGFRLVRTLEEQ